MDRAFIQYDYLDAQHNDWFSVYGGRIANPWMSTEMVYSPDLSFEGFAGTFRWHMKQNNETVKTIEQLRRIVVLVYNLDHKLQTRYL